MRPFDAGLKWMLLHDESWCIRLNGASTIPWVCALFRLASRLGDGWFWYALMGLLLAAEGRGAYAAVGDMLIAGILGLATYKTLKTATSRPRPYQVQNRIRLGAAPLDQFSFPSGHTLHAVSFTLIAIAYFPSLGSVLMPFALLIAMSRVILGLHYPSDVLAGAAIGTALAGVVLTWL
ncbi:MAG TPA: phosphatase PAP2 family protein [Burkholderiales bacterium]